MPPAPEFRDAFGDIGIIEVDQKLKAQHIAEAAGHIGITAEIEIDLEGKGDDPDPRAQDPVAFRGLAQAVPQGPHLVGDEHFFGQPH